jgi:small subunit ribosomal protein S21
MRKKGNFKKKYPKEKMNGLKVKVYNNNVEGALKIFKRMVKDSGLMLELKKKSYYEKPSKKRREKKNLQKLRYKYKENKQN